MENAQTTQCPACGGTVSPAAITCIHCGHPLQKKKRCRSAKWGAILLLASIAQFPLTAPILDKKFGGDYSSAGLVASMIVSILLFVGAVICFTAPAAHE